MEPLTWHDLPRREKFAIWLSIAVFVVFAVFVLWLLWGVSL